MTPAVTQSQVWLLERHGIARHGNTWFGFIIDEKLTPLTPGEWCTGAFVLQPIKRRSARCFGYVSSKLIWWFIDLWIDSRGCKDVQGIMLTNYRQDSICCCRGVGGSMVNELFVYGWMGRLIGSSGAVLILHGRRVGGNVFDRCIEHDLAEY